VTPSFQQESCTRCSSAELPFPSPRATGHPPQASCLQPRTSNPERLLPTCHKLHATSYVPCFPNSEPSFTCHELHATTHLDRAPPAPTLVHFGCLYRRGPLGKREPLPGAALGQGAVSIQGRRLRGSPSALMRQRPAGRNRTDAKRKCQIRRRTGRGRTFPWNLSSAPKRNEESFLGAGASGRPSRTRRSSCTGNTPEPASWSQAWSRSRRRASLVATDQDPRRHKALAPRRGCRSTKECEPTGHLRYLETP